MSSVSIRAQIADRFTPVLVTDEPGWVAAEILLSHRDPTHVDTMLEAQRRSSRGHTDTATGSLLKLEYARLLMWARTGRAAAGRSHTRPEPVQRWRSAQATSSVAGWRSATARQHRPHRATLTRTQPQ